MSRVSLTLERPARRFLRRPPTPLTDADVVAVLRPLLADAVEDLVAGDDTEVAWSGRGMTADVSLRRDAKGEVQSVSATTYGYADDPTDDRADVLAIVDAFLELAGRCG